MDQKRLPEAVVHLGKSLQKQLRLQLHSTNEHTIVQEVQYPRNRGQVYV